MFVVFAFIAAAFAEADVNVRQERAIVQTTGGIYGGYPGYTGYSGYSGVVSPLAYSSYSAPYAYGGYKTPIVSTYAAYPSYSGGYSGAYPSVRYL